MNIEKKNLLYKIISVSLIITLMFSLNSFNVGSTANAETKKNRTNHYTQKAEGEDDFLARLNPLTGWNLAKEMVQIGSSSQGFRLTGTPEGKAAADMVYDKYKELGLKPKYDTFDIYGWRYKDSSFVVEGSDIKINTVSTVGSKPTPENGIEGEIVNVGKGSRQELENIDLNNKIALLTLDHNVQDWQSNVMLALERAGVAGVIYYCDNLYAQDSSGDALNVSNWSGDPADIPVLNTSRNCGEALIDLIGNSDEPYTGKLTSDVDIDENSKGYNVIGQITGSKYPDEYVIVNAHTDAYFQGFQDDTVAIGAMISIAEAMQKSSYTPDRTILFLSMDAEEFGNMGVTADWLAGSWNMLKKYNSEWTGKTVGCMTIELFGYKGTEKFQMRASDTLYDFVSDNTNEFSYKNFNGAGDTINAVSPMSDEFSFAYYGIPTFRTHTDPNVSRTIYHSQLDNESATSYQKYSEAASHYAKLLLRLDKMPVAPYNLVHGIDKYIDAIDFDSLDTTDSTGKLSKLTAEYKNKASALYDQSTEILTLYNNAKAKGNNLSEIDKKLSKYNQKMRDIVNLFAEETNAIEGLHTVRNEIEFYQSMDTILNSAVDALNNGDAEDAYDILMDLPGAWFTQYQDYETWYDANIDFFDPDYRDNNWIQGIELIYFDNYELMVGWKEKIDNKNTTDLTSEIQKCNEFISISNDKVSNAYKENSAMLSKAITLFPIDQGNDIIKAFEKKTDNTIKTNTTSIKTAQKNIYLKKGQKITLPLTEYTNDGKKTKLTYKSGNKKIATVNQKGKVTAKKKGKTSITVTATNGKKLKFKVYVANKSTKTKSIKVKYSKSMKAGKSQIMKITISPKKATKAIATFKSSNKSILTVDKAGRITAKKSGKAKITIKAGGKKKIINIKVK